MSQETWKASESEQSKYTREYGNISGAKEKVIIPTRREFGRLKTDVSFQICQDMFDQVRDTIHRITVVGQKTHPKIQKTLARQQQVLAKEWDLISLGPSEQQLQKFYAHTKVLQAASLEAQYRLYGQGGVYA